MDFLKKNYITITSWVIMILGIIHINFALSIEPVPLKKSFIYFPFQINGWKAKEKIFSDYLVTSLGFDDILIREYQNKEGDILELYFAYFENTGVLKGGEEKGPHTPKMCWVGAGWTLVDLGKEKIELNSKQKKYALVRKVLARRGDEETLLLYLYKANEKYALNWIDFQRYKAIDSIIKGKNSAFTLQLSSDIGGEGIEYKEKQMKVFLREVLTILENSYLP